MADIIKEVMKDLPEGSVSSGGFEGANLVLYTKDKGFFMDNEGRIRAIVAKIKKRIELRADPEICMEPDKAEEVIKKLVPEECSVDNIIFDRQRSLVYIETEKPGVAIGKSGSVLRDVREQTSWTPIVTRTPPIRSQIVEDVRSVLYQNNDERRKFLDRTGHRIYDGWRRGERKNEWVRVTYLGSARQVGRSCIFLQTPESRILLDCGLDLSKDDNEAYPFLEAPEFNINELDAIIVSHAHLDHSGFVPYLFKFGYNGPVYCTAPTRDVMALLMLDYIKNERGDDKEPLYTADEIKKMIKNTITLEFEEVTDITPDLRLTFYNSGHILGSSMVHLHVGNGLHNMLYSTDMKYQKTLLLEPAQSQFQRLETLMLEATYGNKESILPTRQETEGMVKDLIIRTVQRGGKILIPTSGTGRAQEFMILIEQMVRAGELEPLPVYIDGLVWDITAIHTAYPEFLSAQVRKMIFHKDDNPFLSEIFKRVGTPKERQALLNEEGPSVIIATSGMLNGGPSVYYLRNLAHNPANSLIFSCYQGEGTLGRRIMAGEREFNLSKEQVQLHLDVLPLELSNHSDRRELMNFVARCSPRPKKIIVNHGENIRCLDLASSLHKQFRIETSAPRNLETLRLR